MAANPGSSSEPSLDSFSPSQIARMVEASGVKKANNPLIVTVMLGILAGVYIAMGGMFYSLAITDSGMGLGPTRILGGVVFSLGLILVVVGGAELFTGNTMLTMAWIEKKITTLKMLKNWWIIYLSNFVGAIAFAYMVMHSGVLAQWGDAMAHTAIKVAQSKVELSTEEIFFRGILCNMLVCLGVWLAMASRTVSGKVLGIVFPVSAFVAMGFEHCIANMYLIPIGMMSGANITMAGLCHNLVPATLGNIVGGGVFVALIYWAIYIRGTKATNENQPDTISMTSSANTTKKKAA